MKRLIPLLFFLATSLIAVDAESIVKRMDDLMRGKTSYSKLTMTVTTKRSERKMTMEDRTKASSKSSIPKKTTVSPF